MTPDNMVTLLKQRLANSNDSALDSLIITVANAEQEKLEQGPELPWFLFYDTGVDSSPLATIATNERVQLPAGFLRFADEYEASVFLYNTSEDDPWVPLKRDDYSLIKAANTGSGAPTHFDLLRDYLYFRPIPDGVYNIRVLHYQSDADIVAGTTENLWMKHAADVIMARVGLVIASTYVVMPAIAQQFEKERMIADRRLRHDTIARFESGALRQMGDD